MAFPWGKALPPLSGMALASASQTAAWPVKIRFGVSESVSRPAGELV